MRISEYKEYAWSIFKPEIKNHENESYALLYLIGKLITEFNEFLNDESYNEAGDNYWYIFNIITYLNLEDEISVENWSYNEYHNYEATLDRLILIFDKLIKSYYHNKLLDLNEIRMLSTIVCQNIHDIMNSQGFSLEESIENNFNKLNDRHGKQFNSKFYTEQSA